MMSHVMGRTLAWFAIMLQGHFVVKAWLASSRRPISRSTRAFFSIKTASVDDVVNRSSKEATPSTDKTVYTIDYCPPTDPDQLQLVVSKHVRTLPFFLKKRPISKHTQRAFDEFISYIYAPSTRTNHNDNDETVTPTLILDSGCGTGRSTVHLANVIAQRQQENDCRFVVIGVDRSIERLRRNEILQMNNNYKDKSNSSSSSSSSSSNLDIVSPDLADPEDELTDSNDLLIQQVVDPNENANVEAWLIRADLVDFWRLLHAKQIPVHEHYLLYPNPYPKPRRWKLRFYGQPIFPLLFLLQSERIVLRSNWLQFLEEWIEALRIVVQTATEKDEEREPILFWLGKAANEYEAETEIQQRNPKQQEPWTNFEEKYDNVGERTYELVLRRKSTSKQ